MKDEFHKNDEMAIIFTWYFDEKHGIELLKPIKIVRGYFDEEFEIFVDDKNNTYLHYISRGPGFVYGFRHKISELQKDYKVKKYNDVKRMFFDDVKDYEFVDAMDMNGNLIGLAGRNKENKFEKYYYGDVDLDRLGSYGLNDDVLSETDPDVGATLALANDFDAEELSNHVKTSVIGQDEAIENLVTALWTNLQSDKKNNMIIIGGSGVGKTAIIREVAKKLGRSVYKTSATGKSQTGYVGECVTDILKNLIISCNGNLNAASNAIVVLDEFDKLAIGKGGEIATESVQQELLNIVEDGNFVINIGNELSKREVTISTKNITFIGCGAFSGIIKSEDKSLGFGNNIYNTDKEYRDITVDDIIKYGFIPELAGRFPVIIPLNKLTKENYVTILKNPNNSIFTDRLKILENNGITCKVLEEAYDEMAVMAEGMTIGARALDTIVNRTLSDVLKSVSRRKIDYDYVEISKETVHNPKKYVRKKNNS